MIPATIDPLKLQQILNKKPGKTVTAEEWNEILNLLVTQGNYLSDSLTAISQTIQDILNGHVSSIVVDTNVTSFGGRPPEDYSLKSECKNDSAYLMKYINEALINKQDTISLIANRAVYSGPNGKLYPAAVTAPELSYLSGVKSPLQTQIDKRLKTTSTATIHIQQTAPGSASPGDVWIGW